MSTPSVVKGSTAAEEYWSAGYTVIRGAFSPPEIAAGRRECARLFSLFDREGDLHNYRLQFRAHKSGKAALDRIDPVLDISPLLRELSQSPRILSVVAQVFGEPGLLFKDKVILKAPGTHGYRAHQDYTYWQELPAPADAMLSVVIAVDQSSASNGELQFYPGLHHAHMRDPETPSNIFDPGAGLVPEGSLTGHHAVSLDLQAGDAVVFHPLTPHKSDVNESAETRCSIYFSYSAQRYGDLYAGYYENYHRYLHKDRAAEGDLLHFR
jgi:2-aminoethylphosphonate dioxygenase